MGREDKQAQSARGANGSSPGLCLRCLKESKAVRGDQIEVLEILGKSDQSGHRTPIRMSKTTGFPGRNVDFPPKGGGGRGGQKCKISGKHAVQSGQTRSIWSAFWSKSSEFGRVWVAFSSNPCSKAVQNDRLNQRNDVVAQPFVARFVQPRFDEAVVRLALCFLSRRGLLAILRHDGLRGPFDGPHY